MFVRVFKIGLALMLAMLCLMPLTSCSEGIINADCVYDTADLISDEGEQKINDAAKKANNSRFLIVTHDGTTGSKMYGEAVLRDLGIDEDENTVVLVITRANSTYYYNMYTYGTSYRRISDGEVNDILDDPKVYKIKSGDLVGGSVQFIEMTDKSIELPWVIIITVAVIVGAVVGGIVCVVMAAKYKMRMRPTNYPLDKYAKMELTDSNDEFINSRVTVTVISNGGGGRGRSGGGGGGFGGGGGHRGGR